MILFSRLYWRLIPKEEWKRWSCSAACTEGRSMRRKVILFSRLHWRLILVEEDDLTQPLTLKVNRKKVILFSRLHLRLIHWRVNVILFSRLRWRSILEEKGDLIQPLTLKVDPLKGKCDLIQPLTLKVNPLGERWSYSAAYAEGWYLGKKVILFSRLHWRSIH